MTKIQVVQIFDEILEKVETEVLFIRNGKTFTMGLFFLKEDHEVVDKVLAEVVVNEATEEAEVLKVIQVGIELGRKYGRKIHDDTERTLKHWQHVNGFSKVIFSRNY